MTEAQLIKQRIRSKRWRQHHSEQVKEARRRRYQINPRDSCAKAEAWRKSNPQKCWKYQQTDRNREHKRNSAKKYRKNPQMSAYFGALRAMDLILKGQLTGKRGSKFVIILGCPPAEFIVHLEQQFQPGMTWANRGKKRGCWQVDHIRGAATFDLTDPTQLEDFFHYSNTQPLWADENNRKR